MGKNWLAFLPLQGRSGQIPSDPQGSPGLRTLLSRNEIQDRLREIKYDRFVNYEGSHFGNWLILRKLLRMTTRGRVTPWGTG